MAGIIPYQYNLCFLINKKASQKELIPIINSFKMSIESVENLIFVPTSKIVKLCN
jgi:hypothetical protein